jgi:hypothetical protein
MSFVDEDKIAIATRLLSSCPTTTTLLAPFSSYVFVPHVGIKWIPIWSVLITNSSGML